MKFESSQRSQIQKSLLSSRLFAFCLSGRFRAGQPQHRLYFFPLPHGHRSLRPTASAALGVFCASHGMIAEGG